MTMHAMHASQYATHAHAPLGSAESVLIGLAALAIVLLLWVPVDHFNAMGHEGAHALIAAIFGFTVIDIVLDRNRNGLTRYIAGKGLALVLVGVAGYLGPSVFGLVAAWLITVGAPIAVLWLTVLLLVMLLTALAWSFGFISVPVAIALLLAILRYAHTGTEVVLSYGLTWLLLLSGVRVAFAHGTKAGDADILHGHTHLSRGLWALIWMTGTVYALILGGGMLVMGLPAPA